MKRQLLFLMAFLCLNFIGLGQNETDVLRYAFYDITGSARYTGMAGAFGALGADLTSLSYNPAGLGMYRRSEFGFTMNLGFENSQAKYVNNLARNNNVSFNFSNIGVVGSYPTNGEQVNRLNFGISYNKLANFNEKITVQGKVKNTSLLDVFVSQANNLQESQVSDAFPFTAGLAYQTFLINPTDTLGSNQYFHEIPYGSVTQTKAIERNGNMGETALSAAANIRDEWFFGFTLGLPSVEFEETSTYTESELDSTLSLDHYVFSEHLRTVGNGFNIKLGAIYRATDWLRLGAAIHSPTWLTLNDIYDKSMVATFKGENPYSWDSPSGNYQYRIKTPARYMASVAIIAGKKGLISADYEYVDYGASKLKKSLSGIDDYNFSIENEVINQIYRGTHNVKVGAELRMFKVFRLRGGASYQQSPFVGGSVTEQHNTLTYTAGVGLRKKSYYVELATTHKTESSDYYLYDPSRIEAAQIVSNLTQVLISVGFRY